MTPGDRGGPEVRNRRQQVIDELCEHFAGDALEMDEFERRVELAHKAGTLDELQRLLADLPTEPTAPVAAPLGSRPLPSERPGPGMVPASRVKEKDFVLAVLGGSTRSGRWIPAKWTAAAAVCGGAKLDFRDAMLGPGVTEVAVFAFWGGVEIIVPPGMDVEAKGLALMGGFDHQDHVPADHDDGRPMLRIRGVACMGGVDVSVRYPGESARDARRRLKQERKERRRLARGDG